MCFLFKTEFDGSLTNRYSPLPLQFTGLLLPECYDDLTTLPLPSELRLLLCAFFRPHPPFSSCTRTVLVERAENSLSLVGNFS